MWELKQLQRVVPAYSKADRDVVYYLSFHSMLNPSRTVVYVYDQVIPQIPNAVGHPSYHLEPFSLSSHQRIFHTP